MINIENILVNINCLDFFPKISNNIINLIYIDPPFGTKRNLDFEDNFELTDLITFLRNVLFNCSRVLRIDGQIYIHGDYRFIHYIKIEADKIFGIENFRNEIVWYYNSGARTKNCFGKRHDIILRYSKSDKFFFNEDAVRVPYSLSAPRGYEKEKYYHPKGKVMDDVWRINILGQNDKSERLGYSTQKPLELINKIILSSSKENDLILDPMCGSGTVIESCIKNNRRYIGIDKNKKAIEITKSRIEKYGVVNEFNFNI